MRFLTEEQTLYTVRVLKFGIRRLWKWGNQGVNGASLKPRSMHRQTPTTRCGAPWRICSAITLWCSVCEQLHWKKKCGNWFPAIWRIFTCDLAASVMCNKAPGWFRKGVIFPSLFRPLWPIRREAWWRRGAPVTGTLTNEASHSEGDPPCQRLRSAPHCPRFLAVTLNGHHYPSLSEAPRSHIAGEQISLSCDGPLRPFKKWNADTWIAGM